MLEVIKSKAGDRYVREQVTHDFEAVLAMGFFDPLKCRLQVKDGPRGGKVIIFQLSEYLVISEVQYKGLNSVSWDEIVARLKERKIDLSVGSVFIPEKLNAAREIIRELLAEKEHPEAKVETWVEDLSATACALTFKIDEGPRIRK